MKPIRYLTATEVARISEREIGPNLLAAFNLLESAVLRPQTTVGGHDAYPDLHTKAAAMFHSLVRNHPFIDGNKRTGVLAIAVFYTLNDHELIDDTEAIISLAVDTAEGLLTVDAIAGRLKSMVREQA